MKRVESHLTCLMALFSWRSCWFCSHISCIFLSSSSYSIIIRGVIGVLSMSYQTTQMPTLLSSGWKMMACTQQAGAQKNASFLLSRYPECLIFQYSPVSLKILAGSNLYPSHPHSLCTSACWFRNPHSISSSLKSAGDSVYPSHMD